MNCECWLTRGRHDCVCCRINWRAFCTASACCVEDGCVLSYQRGGGGCTASACCVEDGKRVSAFILTGWGWEVPVCSDTLGVLGVAMIKPFVKESLEACVTGFHFATSF